MNGYEPGMRVSYDDRSKRAIVAFRGRFMTLPEEFDDERAAIKAGEDYCRAHGWMPKTAPTNTARSLKKPRVFNF